MRMDNSVCDSPSGSVRVRDALVVVSFVLSNVVQSAWISHLPLVNMYNYTMKISIF